MHKKGVVHRDLKPANVMFSRPTIDSEVPLAPTTSISGDVSQTVRWVLSGVGTMCPGRSPYTVAPPSIHTKWLGVGARTMVPGTARRVSLVVLSCGSMMPMGMVFFVVGWFKVGLGFALQALDPK